MYSVGKVLSCTDLEYVIINMWGYDEMGNQVRLIAKI